MRAERTPARLCSAIACAALLASCGRSPGGSLSEASVLLVVADALRADHLGCYGYDRPTSPFLDELAERAVLFESATGTASHTVPSVLSLLTSARAARHGNLFFPKTQSFRAPRRRVRPAVPEGLDTLAERFRRGGFRTGAVVSNPWLAARYGFDRGFERYLHVAKKTADRDHVRGGEVNRSARELLEAWRGERFFLYVHYMDAHSPYDPPEPHRSRFLPARGAYVYRNGPLPDLSEADLHFTRALYDAEIRSLDDHLRDLFSILDELSLGPRTLVVFTADHGEEFHEHGGMGHGWTLYEEVLRTPLLFVHPALEAHARRIAAPVSALDVHPTVLDLVGESVPGEIDGISLAPWILGPGEPPAERAVASEMGSLEALRRGRFKWLREPGADESAGVFDLVADPGEQRPRTSAELGVDEPWSAPVAPSRNVGIGTPLPAPASAEEERLERQLEALGYVESTE